jgi:hypothetical protein
VDRRPTRQFGTVGERGPWTDLCNASEDEDRHRGRYGVMTAKKTREGEKEMKVDKFDC